MTRTRDYILDTDCCPISVFSEVPVGKITSRSQPVHDICDDVVEEVEKVHPTCDDFSKLQEEHLTPNYDEEMDSMMDGTQASQAVPDKTQAEGH